MSDHLIAEANRHAEALPKMTLPTTKPNDLDLAWYRRECELLQDRNEVLEVENARLQMELDASYNAEELRQARAENAALREDKERLDWLESLHSLWEGTEKTGPVFLTRVAIDAARKEVQP